MIGQVNRGLNKTAHSFFLKIKNGHVTRKLSVQSNKNAQRNIVIFGSSSSLGFEITNAAIKKGWNGIYLQRSHFDDNLITKKTRFVRLEDDDIYSEKVIRDIVNKHFKELNGNVVVVNAIGGAYVPSKPKDKTMKEFNLVALRIAHSINSYKTFNKTQEVTYVNLSSIASMILKKDEYGNIKKQIDDHLFEFSNYPEIERIVNIKLGYVISDLPSQETEGENKVRRKNEHTQGLSFDQIAFWSPLQPVILSHGEEYEVPLIHVSNVVDVALNSSQQMEKDNKAREVVIGAAEYKKPSEIYKFLAPVFRKKFREYRIDLKDFSTIVTNFPHGHVQPYVLKFLERQTGKPMNLSQLRRFTNASIKTLEDVVPEPKDKAHNYEIPFPFLWYGSVVLKNLVTRKADSQAFYTLGKVAINGSILYFKYRTKEIKEVVNKFFNRSNRT